MVATIHAEDVLNIHERLAEDFAASQDPISPPGIKSLPLLESAIGRQHTGMGFDLKYKDPVSNAASLCYGICLNHPFHNGNKRTALVALLCHLDKNDLTLTEDVTQDELYSFMRKLASHDFAPRLKRPDASDVEVEKVAQWLRSRVRRVDRSERRITYRELRVILRKYNYELENPKGNGIDIVKYEQRRKWPIFGPLVTIRTRCGHLPYPGDKKVVGKDLMKRIRKMCRLTEDDGVDSATFYSGKTHLDQFITKYRRTLNRLAKA